MNLASMLEAASRHQIEPKRTDTELLDARRRNLALGGKAHSEKAIKRYQSVMAGKGWMKRRQIENALGYASTVSTAFLRKLLDKGYVERRNKGGAEKPSRSAGYEWRWVESL